jgi:adenylate cyclase
LEIDFEDRGEQQLKNISKPVRAYAVCTGTHRAPAERLGAVPHSQTSCLSPCCRLRI